MALFVDQPWRSRAACRERGFAVFFMEYDQGIQNDPAKQLCAVCPVAEDCREYAIGEPDLYGVWGGLTRRQRREIRLQRRRHVA